jgi:hypothetical protein
MIKSRRMVRRGHVAFMGKKTAWRTFMGKSEGERTLGRHRRKWWDDIKINLRKK